MPTGSAPDSIDDICQDLEIAGIEGLFAKFDSFHIELGLAIGSNELEYYADPEWSSCVEAISRFVDAYGIQAVATKCCQDPRTVLALIADDVAPYNHFDLIIWAMYESRCSAIHQNFPVSNAAWATQCPHLASHINDEGLIELDQNIKFNELGFIENELLVPFHSSLGHGQPGLEDKDLLSHLLSCRTDQRVRIQLAPNAVRCIALKEAYASMNKDHWWGRKFSRLDLDDPNSLGSTVHTAPARHSPGSNAWEQCMMKGIKRLETAWSRKPKEKDCKVLVMEEVIDRSGAHGRFIHAIRNMGSHVFEHLDGAFMIYSDKDRPERLQPSCNLPKTPKASRKPKVFRIDGEISTDMFSAVVSLFYRGNPLIDEYFAPPAPSPPPTS